MSKEKQAAQEILKHIGGQENILNVEHCATRLRLVLKDASEFDKKEIEAIDGVKGSFFASGQHQIILGTGFVNKVYQQVLEITGMDTGKMMSKAEAAAVNMKDRKLIGQVQVSMHGITGGDDYYLAHEAENTVANALRKCLSKDGGVKELRKAARDALLSLLWERTKQRPMVVVNLLEV